MKPEPHTIDRAALRTLDPAHRPRREGRGLTCCAEGCRTHAALIADDTGGLVLFVRHHGHTHESEFSLERLIREMAPQDKQAALLALLKG